ncbi:sensor histidine kinase [Actinocrispum sp. NPDC049592]|uniref:sensor histidine kinase n=1 Tax=Actinocrispum sp. NPDC049592 TaxID=3154835 RepID=UPI003423B6D4
MRTIRALPRSALLFAVALACLPVLVLVIVAFCFVFPAPWAMLRVRRFSSMARTLAGVSNVGIYWDPPAPMEPDEEGYYQVNNRLVRNPWWHEFSRRLDWVTDDPGARRDLAWLFCEPLVGGPLAGLGPGALAFGVWLTTTSWWPLAVPLGIAGVLATPYLVRLHARWTSAMLRGRPEGRMARLEQAVELRVKQIWHALVLFLLAVASVLVTLVTAVLAIPMHWFGLWMFGWRPVIESGRALTNLRRSLVTKWTDVPIPRPYLPHPPPPQRRADGMYRRGRQLYKTPNIPMRLAMYRWVMTDPATWRDLASGFLDTSVGLFAVPASIFAAPWVLRLQGRVSRFLLAPTAAAQLAQRVQHLTVSRAEANDAQAAELRRIERDLHDGAQARLVALGMTLGAVERLIDQDPELAKNLVAKSREASADALVELRDLVRGIHPPVLAERGLGDAIRAQALDSPLNVTVSGSLSDRLDAPIESAAYFAVNELLVNAAKHARADHVDIQLGHSDGILTISVTDDGQGGANPDRGSGLAGLRRRLAAFDGTLTLDSPRGGPTVASLRIPTP